MFDDDILIMKGQEILSVLDGREPEVIDIVRLAYMAHGAGASSLPHSTFLRFPDNPRNRIIALPAYLGADFDVAGIKWVSSFPGNIEAGKDRASAVVILSSLATGRPEAVMEGSIISAKRTAASAALAAQHLHEGRDATTTGLVGCGLIGFETVRFLLAARPDIERLLVFDMDAGRAGQFKENCEATFGRLEVEVAPSVSAVLRAAPLVALATTATQPHIADLSGCLPGSTILHISLRDIMPEAVLSCDNVVDDADHVSRAQTSIHLAEQLLGSRDFIRCTLADVLHGTAAPKSDPHSVTVFSPFGLGVLDIAVSKYVRDLGLRRGLGTVIDSFLPSFGVAKTTANYS
jgi:ornithine cyclodeaminase